MGKMLVLLIFQLPHGLVSEFYNIKAIILLVGNSDQGNLMSKESKK